MTSGWQQQPVREPVKCAHLGLIFAAMTMTGHPVGHTWKCMCGKVFVVGLDSENRKTFKDKE